MRMQLGKRSNATPLASIDSRPDRHPRQLDNAIAEWPRSRLRTNRPADGGSRLHSDRLHSDRLHHAHGSSSEMRGSKHVDGKPSGGRPAALVPRRPRPARRSSINAATSSCFARLSSFESATLIFAVAVNPVKGNTRRGAKKIARVANSFADILWIW